MLAVIVWRWTEHYGRCYGSGFQQVQETQVNKAKLVIRLRFMRQNGTVVAVFKQVQKTRASVGGLQFGGYMAALKPPGWWTRQE